MCRRRSPIRGPSASMTARSPWGVSTELPPPPSALANPYDQKSDRGPCSYDTTHVLRVNGVAALPFHGNRLVEGWQISGIVSASSGVPFNVYTGLIAPGTADQSTVSRVPTTLAAAIRMRELRPSPNGSIRQCYTLQARGTTGNTGRNSLARPRFLQRGYFSPKRHED